MRIQKTAGICLIIALLAASASATYLRIIPTLSPPDVIQGDSAEIPLTVVNKGDEPAYNLQFTLILPEGLSAQNLFVRGLNANEEKKDRFTVDIGKDMLPGTYVVGVLTHYQDANEYTFSSVNSLLLNYKNPSMSRMLGTMPNIELDKDPVDLTMTLRNRDEKPHDIQLQLILPDELKADKTRIEDTIDGNSEKEVPLTIKSTGALQGSTYPVMAIMTYTDGKQHYSSIIRNVVTIKNTTPKNPFSWQTVLPVFGILVVGGYIVFKRFRKTRRNR